MPRLTPQAATQKAATLLTLGLAYYLCAAQSFRLARINDGLPFVWVATPLLVAHLVATPRREWPLAMLVAGLADLLVMLPLVNGVTATALMLANMTEALLAGWMLARLGADGNTPGADLAAIDPAAEAPGETAGWMARALGVLAVVAPLTSAGLATLALTPGSLSAGWDILRTWYLAHALGMIIFYPACAILRRAWTGRRTLRLQPRQVAASCAFVALMTLISTLGFGSGPHHHPMLFVPVLVLAASTVFTGEVTLTLMFIVLTVVGGWLTVHGDSPMAMLGVDIPRQMQLLQIYLAATMLCMIPISGSVQRLNLLLVRLRESEARYRLLADNCTDIILRTDPRGEIGFVSHSVLHTAKHRPDTLIGTRALRLVARQHRRQVMEAYRQATISNGQSGHVEFLGLPAGAGPRWFDAHMRAVRGAHGRVSCVVSVVRDMAERKEYEDALAQAAFTDPLTALPNRRRFMDALRATIAEGREGCVALIDLDHFKQVNDRYGHAAGDEVLRNFGCVAREGLRATDMLARIGGEEFALLLPGASLEVAERICQRLGQTLADAVTRVGDECITVTSSIGLAPLGRDADVAIAMADGALYAAKGRGRDQLAIAA